MKKLLFISFAALAFLTGCSSSGGNGELVGVYTKSWTEPTPYGMAYIKRGSFVMGNNDQEANWSMTSQSRTVSIDPFWMDDTEITNGEYKQFVYWVRDSIAREKLADAGMEEYRITEDKKGNPVEPAVLNWHAKIPWSKASEEESEVIKGLFYSGDEAIEIDPQFNDRLLNYKYLWIDYDQAALKINKYNPLKGGYERSIEGLGVTKDSADVMIKKDTAYYTEDGQIVNRTVYRELKSRSEFISSKIINIYPDTMCWVRDFTYAYNEPYMKMYFYHPGYGEYPVVGVSWEQASAFCHWRTFYYNSYQLANGGVQVQAYRLPTEAEWEYAARGGRKLAMYPWGGSYIRTKRGCYLANFKPQRGNYTEDGYMIPAKVGSYPPNDFGLYDMAGNVSEWTSSAYHESNYSFVHDMNPNYQYNAKSFDADVMRRKVIRGGSWKDVAYFLQCGTRTYEYQQEAHSYIGFRCVRSVIGAE
ncbi:MAG: gliding motility-associated lipoprotein GldK [Bacteroidales bacterium]|jgi:formylglycine-generating enzyme required for sulfatase activity|nr:gliding motility-associated lipoprotein GldK [Bacteroidales bacterium]MBR6311248.1 SUMF1/EgtB/PvdO family nonheme iron enzyme [Paludibacteraceae bacterium]MDD6357164.1 SUMF1/EgtB/PvdO family nonheme iron enzyme [Bacteroidales bacterium]